MDYFLIVSIGEPFPFDLIAHPLWVRGGAAGEPVEAKAKYWFDW